MSNLSRAINQVNTTGKRTNAELVAYFCRIPSERGLDYGVAELLRGNNGNGSDTEDGCNVINFGR